MNIGSGLTICKPDSAGTHSFVKPFHNDVVSEDAGKVCSFKPSSSSTSTNSIIEQGKNALCQLEQDKHTWVNWVFVSGALQELQTLAMAAASADTPHGPVYRKAIKRYLACYGFDRIHKSTRSLLIEIARNLLAIEAWRSTLNPEELFDLNHPRVVLARWKKSLQSCSVDTDSREASPPPNKTLSDPLAIWATFSDEQKRQILDHEPRLVAIMSPKLLGELQDRIIGQSVATASPTTTFAKASTGRIHVMLRCAEQATPSDEDVRHMVGAGRAIVRDAEKRGIARSNIIIAEGGAKKSRKRK